MVSSRQLGVDRWIHLEIRVVLCGLQQQSQEIPKELSAVVQEPAGLFLMQVWWPILRSTRCAPSDLVTSSIFSRFVLSPVYVLVV